MGGDSRAVSQAAVLIGSVLVSDPVLLSKHRVVLVTIVLFLTCAHRVSEMRVFLSVPDLLLHALLFGFELLYTVLDHEGLHLPLLEHQFLLEFVGALHVGDVLAVFGRDSLLWQGSETQEVGRHLLLRNFASE